MKRAIVFVVLLSGCGDSEGEGSLALVISGEQPALTGYPDAESGLAFVDGWSLTWDKYLASVGNVRLASSDGEVAVEGSDAVILDLHEGDAVAFTFEDLPARRWDLVSYDTPAAKADARILGEVAQADVNAMVQGGLNYLIEATATKGERTVKLRWGIAAPVHAKECRSGADGKPGLVVRESAEARHQLTLHLDHVFYDHLGDHLDAVMRFDAIAAVAGEDGVVTLDALAAQKLLELKDGDGEPLQDATTQAVIVYDPFGTQLANQDLESYIVAASESQPHFDGEGGCNRTSL